jgi:hypothetical protein
VVDGLAPAAFKLTTATDDDLTGSANADTIEGVVSSLLTEGTLQGTDKVDGGEGSDTLNLDMKQNFAGFTTGSMKSVETVNITNSSDTAGTLSFNAANVTGVTKYTVDADVAPVNLTSLNSLADIEVSKQSGTSTFTASYGAASEVATGSQSDTQNLKVTDVGTINTSTTSVSNAQFMTTNIANVEALEVTTAGSANSLNLSGVTGATSTKISGAGQTEIDAVSSSTTSFDASGATGNVIVNLAAAGANALTSVKSGTGDDTLTAVVDDLTTTATISAGAGDDTVALSGGARTLQLDMSGAETLNLSNTGALIFSGLNVTDIDTVNINGAGAQGAVTMTNVQGTTPVTVNSVGATAAVNFSNDTAANVTFNTQASAATLAAGTAADANAGSATFNGTNDLTVNIGEHTTMAGAITSTSAKNVELNVASKEVAGTELVTYGSTLTVSEAAKVTIKAEGQLAATAAVVAAKATSMDVTTGSSAADILSINAGLVTTAQALSTLTIDANHNLDLSGSSLVDVQTFTADTERFLDLAGEVLDDAATVTVSGSNALSQATFSTLGTAATTHDVNLTATGLKAGLTTGAINAGTASTTVNIGGVTGNVTLAAITANNGITLDASGLDGTLANAAAALTTTTGNINVYLDSVGDTATIGALNSGVTSSGGDVTLTAKSAIGNVTTGVITGNNVTIDASNALGAAGVTVGNGYDAGTTVDVNATSSVTYKGSGIVANGLDIATTAASTAFVADLNGTGVADSFTVDGNIMQTSITVKGNLGGGANILETAIVDNTGAIGGSTTAQTVDISALTSGASVNDTTATVAANAAAALAANYETFTVLTADIDSALTFKGSAKDDIVNMLVGSTTANSFTDTTVTDSDTLSISGTHTQLTLSGIENIDTTGAASLNASAISGQAITAVTAGILTLTDTVANDVIDLSNITNTGAATNLLVTATAGNDVIVGTTGTETITGGAGADTSTGGAGVDVFNFGVADSIAGTDLDTITDFNNSGAGDIIRLAAAGTVLAAEGDGTTATTDVDTTAGGLVSFAVADDTYAEKVAAIQADAQLDVAGSVAIFTDAGSTYFYSAGAAAGNVDDQIIKLTGVTLSVITGSGGTDLTVA